MVPQKFNLIFISIQLSEMIGSLRVNPPFDTYEFERVLLLGNTRRKVLIISKIFMNDS